MMAIFFCFAAKCDVEAAAPPTIIDGLDYTLNHVDLTATVKGLSDTNLVNLVIPDTVEYNSKIYDVTAIDYWAFTQKVITGTLTLGKNLTKIGDHAFSYCGFTGDLAIPDSVTSIGHYAFYNCNFGGTLTLGDNLESIGESAFQNTKFTGDLVIPDSVTSIGSHAFDTSNFNGTLTLSNKLQAISDYAFAATLFTGDLVIPDSVTSVGKGTFEASTFNGTLTLSKNLKDIGQNAFSGSHDSVVRPFTGDLVIPDGVTSIEANAFANSSFNGSLIFLGESGTTIPLPSPINESVFHNVKFDGEDRLTNMLYGDITLHITELEVAVGESVTFSPWEDTFAINDDGIYINPQGSDCASSEKVAYGNSTELYSELTFTGTQVGTQIIYCSPFDVTMPGDSSWDIHMLRLNVIEATDNGDTDTDTDTGSGTTPDGNTDTDVDTDADTSSDTPFWVPTADDIYRMSFKGFETLNMTTNLPSYGFRLENSEQGSLCFDVFNAVRGDYTLARTYNGYAYDRTGFDMPELITATLEIPKLLQEENRTFMLISVKEGGNFALLKDLDEDANTITFTTDKCHAFALCYQD